MGKTCVFVLCALVACSPTLARAQSYESVGIRAQGMAGAFVAVADDATASWWNPAGLATSQSLADLIVEGGEGGHWGIALGFPSLGLSYYRLNISQIQPAGSTAAAASNRQDLGAVGTGLSVPDSIALDQVGATIGQSIGGHLVVASTLKLTHARSETEAGLDLGAMAAFGPMRAGLTVRDVTGGTFGPEPGAFELTRRARAGVAVMVPPRGRLDGVTLAFDADLNKAPVDGRDERHIAGGAEAWMLGRRIGVRGGAGVAITDAANDGGGFGAFGVSVSPFEKVYLTGEITRGADSLRNRWGIDLRVTF
jgi:hypothetical protein